MPWHCYQMFTKRFHSCLNTVSKAKIQGLSFVSLLHTDRTKRQTWIIVMRLGLSGIGKTLSVEHGSTEVKLNAMQQLFHIMDSIFKILSQWVTKEHRKLTHIYIRFLLTYGCYSNVKIQWVMKKKNLLNFPYFRVISDFIYTFQNLCVLKSILSYLESVDILY